VGLTLATLFTKYGVPYRIIDQHPAPVIQTKAAGLWSKTLEALHHMGLAERFLEVAHRSYSGHVFAGGQERVHLDLSKIPSYYNFVTLLPQHQTESTLTESLAAGGVTVERGLRLLSLNGHTATLESVQDGQSSSAEFRFVFGCDGAHSQVRKEIGATFEGSQFPGFWMVGDMVIEGQGLPVDEVSMFLGPEGPFALFALGQRRYRVVASGNEMLDPVPVEFFEDAARARLPFPVTLSDPQHMTTFVIHERQADKYSNGIAFLLGDAAHIHSPAGGQGLNTGMQDAFNLAWKVAQVMLWGSPPALLDSYQTERHPVAKKVLETTSVAMRMVSITNPVVQKVRAAAMSLVGGLEVTQSRIREGLSEVDIHYGRSPLNAARGSKTLDPGDRMPEVFWRDRDGLFHRLYDLFTGFHWTILSDEKALSLPGLDPSRLRQVVVARQAGPGDSFSDPAKTVAEACGLKDGGHLLIRPDGYLAGYFASGEEEALRSYWDLTCAGQTASPQG
jgi:2-polyprenyl-6-methoxyphenol hydroxylase-like FAD-dependent oxidoreductase